MLKRELITTFLGLGTNLGNREDYLLKTLDLLGKIAMSPLIVSSIYDTPPLGPVKQENYLNMCLSLKTELKSGELLNKCKEIEKMLGRRKSYRWGPREIDIDILDYGSKIINDSELNLPHPEIPQRQFVLLPWSEICPDFIHPLSGKAIKVLLEENIRHNGEDTIYFYRHSSDIDYAAAA